jgi:hypothetical protein
VTCEDIGRQHCVSRRTGASFEVGSLDQLDSLGPEPGTEPGSRLGDDLRLSGGASAQPMIDMDRSYLAPCCDREHE